MSLKEFEFILVILGERRELPLPGCLSRITCDHIKCAHFMYLPPGISAYAFKSKSQGVIARVNDLTLLCGFAQ